MGFCDEDGDGNVDCRECFRASAKIVLLIINVIWFALGGALLGVGAYALAFSSSFGALFDQTGLYIAIFVGVALFFVSIIGTCGVFKLHCKSLLLIYGVCLFVLACLMAGVGTLLLSYTNTLNTDSGVGDVDQVQRDAREFVSNYINCTYNKCCITNSTEQELAACSSSDAGTIQNGFCTGLDELQIKDCSDIGLYRDAVTGWLTNWSTTLSSGFYASAGFQFLGFIIACMFVCTKFTGKGSIKPYEYES